MSGITDNAQALVKKFSNSQILDNKKTSNMEVKHFRNDGKLKLLIIVGTRPEIIRLAAVINKCRQYFDVRAGCSGFVSHAFYLAAVELCGFGLSCAAGGEESVCPPR